ncbi:MAG: lycopene cyclase domain-containing protein [Patescibacteria group bacterium]
MEYLIGSLVVGVLWVACLILRKDLRYQMLWAGGLYAAVMTVGFFAVKLFKNIPEYQAINPGYWTPDTLFDLNYITGGFSIEDVLFMLFFGGIVAVMYELIMRVPPPSASIRSGAKLSIPLGIVAAALVSLTGVNLIYSLIIFGFVGAFVIWLQRPDLIRRSLVSGASFLVLYIGLYSIFLFFFPTFVTVHYNLENISGVVPLGIPLEEYLYALGFGSSWSVVYPYMRALG